MRDRHAVAGAQPAEIVPLHTSGIALADTGPGHIDILARHEMPRGDLGANRDKRVLGNAELRQFRLRLDFCGGEVAALRLGHILDLGGADAELQCDVPVPLLRALRDDLTVIDAQHCDRDMVALVGKNPAHAELPRDQTGSHSGTL